MAEAAELKMRLYVSSFSMIWFHTAKLEPLRRVCILKSEYKLLNLYESEFICGMIPDIMPNFAADQYNNYNGRKDS